MSGDMGTARVRPAAPAMGHWVPTAMVHVAFLAVAVGLCLLVLAPPFWLAVGVLLAVGAIVAPTLVPAWWLLLLLSLGQLWRAPMVADVVFSLLLAGVHLLHLLASLARLLPWRGRMQLRAFALPLRRYLLVQVITQAIAIGALRVFGGSRGTVSGLSILAAVLLAVVAAVLLRGLRGGWARGNADAAA
jgi:hypothetical protein